MSDPRRDLAPRARALAEHAAELHAWAVRAGRADKAGWSELDRLVSRVLEALPELSDAGANQLGASHEYGPETERAAAYRNMPKSGSQRLRVLECLYAAGLRGRTDQEMEEILGLKRPSPGSRRGELVQGGWVKDSGRRRATDLGNLAVVWVLTAEARARCDAEFRGMSDPQDRMTG